MHGFQPGDVFACFGTDAASRFIRCATASLRGPRELRLGPSHVAICAHDHCNTLSWWESTSLATRPCAIQGIRVRGVQVHNPLDRIDDYVRAGGRVVVYRLTEIDALGAWESQHLYRMLRVWIRRRTTYDMVGAALSGMRVTSWLRMLPSADEDLLFCSELIAAVLMRLSRLNRTNPTSFNPAKLLRELVYSGTYHKAETYDSVEAIARTVVRESILPLREVA